MRLQNRTLLGTTAFALLVLLSPQLAHAQGALDRLSDLINQVKPGATQPPPASVPTPATKTMKVERPYIGAMLDTILSNSNPGDNQGILVTEVNTGGPADKAGLKKGDRILLIDDAIFSSIDELGQWLDTKKPGDKVNLKVRRGDKNEDLTLVLGSQEVEVPVNPSGPVGTNQYDPINPGPLPPPANPSLPGMANAPRVLGVRVVPVNDQIRQQTGVTVRRGAFVESVSQGGVADQANIPAGAVIVTYDGRRVDDAVELIQLVRNSPADRLIPVNYYVGNRMGTAFVFYGAPSQRPQLPPMQPGATPGQDRPALRILQQALQGVEGNVGAGVASQEQVDSLSRRVRELEAQVRALQQELQAMKGQAGEL